MLTLQIRMDDRVVDLLARAVAQLTRIGDGTMALKEELEALVTALNAATNKVADEIAALKKQIADLLANPDNITPEAAASIEAGLQGVVDKLAVLGADPANPVPVPAPPPAA